MLDSVNIGKLTQDRKMELDVPITLEEVKEAIGSLKGNTSTGTDGLTVEFYKTFEKTLSGHLFDMFEREKVSRFLGSGKSHIVAKGI